MRQLVIYLIFAFNLLGFSIKSYAGLIELSYSASFSNSQIDNDNFTKTLRNTASIAWYFLETSALEISYSQGEQQISLAAAGDQPTKYRSEFLFYGADLVFSFGGKDAVLQPYVKGGVAFVEKKLFRKETPLAAETLISETDGSEAVPSWGVGFKFMIFKNVRLKASYDRVRSNRDNNGDTWDSTIGGGISFFL